MALLAIGRSHIAGMGLVTLRALRRFPVNAMACRAVESRMFALVFTQLLDLGRMTGKTGFRECGREGDRQGGVGIRMACQTPLRLKVRLALVTLIAGGNIVL